MGIRNSEAVSAFVCVLWKGSVFPNKQLDLWQWHKMCSTSPTNIGELTPIDTNTECTCHVTYWISFPQLLTCEKISYSNAYGISTVRCLFFPLCYCRGMMTAALELETKTTQTMTKKRRISAICIVEWKLTMSYSTFQFYWKKK